MPSPNDFHLAFDLVRDGLIEYAWSRGTSHRKLAFDWDLSPKQVRKIILTQLRKRANRAES